MPPTFYGENTLATLRLAANFLRENALATLRLTADFLRVYTRGRFVLAAEFRVYCGVNYIIYEHIIKNQHTKEDSADENGGKNILILI